MIELAESEARVIALARAALGATAGRTGPLLRETHIVPAKLGPTAASALEQTLARGSVARLAKAGWKTAFWATDPPIRLTFTHRAVDLLRWALAEPLGRDDLAPTRIGHLAATGDELLALGLGRLLARHGMTAALNRPPFATSPLVALALGDAMPIAPIDPDWLGGGRRVLLGALRDELADDAVRIEASLLANRDADQLARVGEARETTLDGLLDALEAEDVRPLASFLVHAAPRLPATDLAFEGAIPLSERQRAATAAGAQLRAIARIGRWTDALGAVRFFDDAYDAARSQLRALAIDEDLRTRLAARERRRRETVAVPADVPARDMGESTP